MVRTATSYLTVSGVVLLCCVRGCLQLGVRQLADVLDGRRQALGDAVDHRGQCELRLVLRSMQAHFCHMSAHALCPRS